MTSPAANWSTPANEPPRNEPEAAIQVQQMGLKVHYTFDKLEQTRCLARLPQLIQVQSLSLDEKTTIGIIDLNLCLSAVSQGSPELINSCTNPHSTIDYAVYVYDYSEPDTPLVGHGMLSGLLQNQHQNASATSSTGYGSMVTGLVTRNLLAMFGKGISHTLEVKMKFSESQRVTPKPVIVAPQPIRQPVAVTTISEIQSSIEPLLTPAGSAEWSMLVQSNPQLAAQLAHLTPAQQSRALTMDAASRGQSPAVASSRVASPAAAPPITRQDSYTDSAQQQQQHQQPPPMHQLRHTFQIQQPQQPQQQQSSRQGTPVETPTAAPAKEKAVLETVPLGDQAPSRPSSRASRKRGATGRPRGRPRKNATPSEANGNTSGYEDGTDDDPPPKRRVTTTTVTKTLNTPFAQVPESLRVAASTSGSLRAFRPKGFSEPSNASSHMQDTPRAPTPVPFAEKVKPRVTGSLRRTSTLNQEHTNHATSNQSEDARSPNDQPLAAPTPFSEASTPDFGSSPPMSRTSQFLHRSSPAPSSPILPPMPMSTNDSGFMSGGLDDFHENSRQARTVRQKATKIHGKDPRIPVHVFHVGNGAPVVYKNSVDVTSKSKSANIAPPPPPQQVAESTAPPQQLIPTGPPLAHPALYAPPQPKMPLPRLDRSQQPSTACSPDNNSQPHYPPTFQQNSPEVGDSAPVTPAQTNEGDKQGVGAGSGSGSGSGSEIANPSQPQSYKTGQRTPSMHPPQHQKMPSQTHHVQQSEKQQSSQSAQAASGNTDLSAGQVNFESQSASQNQDTRSQSMGSQDMIMADLGFASTENRVFSGADGSAFDVGDFMVLGQAMDESHASGQQTNNSEEMSLEAQESMMIRALGMTMDNAQAEAEAPIETPGQSAPHRPQSATPPQLEADLALPETAKANQGSHASRRKTPNSVATTPHPTSFSEAPCPPSDSAIMLPYPPVAATSPPAGGRSNKNYVKKLAIKEKLEQAVMNGEMPPFCSNCGAIETPTWRKIYVQECTGTPAYHEYSDKPGRVTAIEITTRDEAQNPTGYRMIKKSLAGDDDKSKWNDALLCNPCGIWLCKNNKHRPMDRWDKDAERLGQERRKRGTGRAPVRKRKNTSAASTANANASAGAASQSVFTSDAGFLTDPLCPVDYVSSISEGQLALPTTAHASSTITRACGNNTHSAGTGQLDSNSADAADTGNSHDDDGTAVAGAVSGNGASGQSRHSTAGNTPENCEYGDLGNTRRLLFPYSGNARSGTTRKPLDERSLNSTRPPNRRHHEYTKTSSIEDNTVLAMSEADSLALDNEIAALFRSPVRGFERPSTPPGHSSSRELEFKTPSRPTPSHRPITRSVSRSIRSVRSSKHLQAQNGMPETPSRITPRPSSSAVAELRAPESPSLRRSPRINKGLRSTGKKILTIGGKQVEAAMSDIDAALAEFSRSITDQESVLSRHSSQHQIHRQARSSMQSPEKSDLDTYLKSSMVDQWSPTKDWTQTFGMDMLNHEDLQMWAESLQDEADDEGGSLAT